MAYLVCADPILPGPGQRIRSGAVLIDADTIVAGGPRGRPAEMPAARETIELDFPARPPCRADQRAHGLSSIRSAIEAGVDIIEHCTWLDGGMTPIQCGPGRAARASRGGPRRSPTSGAS